MGRRENLADLDREREANKVRAVEAAKSAWHSVALIETFLPGEVSDFVDAAKAAVSRLQDAARRVK